MQINTNHEISTLVIGGQSYDVSSLNNDAIAQLARSLGAQDNAFQEFHASTQTLEFRPQTGSKGANFSDIFSQLREDEEAHHHSFEEEDEEEEAADEDYDFDEDDFNFNNEHEETEEEREEREFLESFAIPASKFSDNDIRYFKQNDVDVTDLNELMNAKVEINRLDKEYNEEQATELAQAFLNNDIQLDEFVASIRELSV